MLSRLLPATEVDTVVHCGILWYPEPGRPARALHEINVIGTLQLLAACERTESLRTVVVRGSAAIYGCEGAVPSFYTEDLARAQPLRTRFQRDISELEEYFENFARRHPELTCCMLRYQPEIGPGLDSPLVRYLTLPVVPVQLGFDPRLQLLHADDATGAIEAAVANPVRGAVNVAPDGSISLSRALRLLGRPAVPLPARRSRAVLARRQPPARRRRPARRRDQAAALRPRRRQHAGWSTEVGYEPRLRRGRGGPRPRRRRPAAADRARPPSGRARRAARRALGRGRLSDARAARRRSRPRRSPTSCATCAAGSRPGSTRWRPPSEAAGSLPGRLRYAIEPVVRRLQGDYHEDEWGFDEGFAEAVFPLFEFLYELLVAGRGRGGPQRARRTAAA